MFYFLWSYVVRLPVGSEQNYGQHGKTHFRRRTEGTEDGLGKGETRVLPTERVGEERQFGYRDTTFIKFLGEHEKTKYFERNVSSYSLNLIT